jgi:hypothetical protein
MSNYETMTPEQIRQDVEYTEPRPIETKYNAALDALEDLLAELQTWERRGSIEWAINFLTRNSDEILE